jgi:hypothetical protein
MQNINKRYLNIDEFCKHEGLTKSYVYKLTMAKALPLKMFRGEVVKPYQVDMLVYQSLVTTTEVDCSLKTEKTSKPIERRPIPLRKDSLWHR